MDSSIIISLALIFTSAVIGVLIGILFGAGITLSRIYAFRDHLITGGFTISAGLVDELIEFLTENEPR